MGKDRERVCGSGMARFLDLIEGVGNRLPHPTVLFACLSLSVLVLTALLAAFGASAETSTGRFEINTLLGNDPINLLNPRNGDVVASYTSGRDYCLQTLTPNFVNFAPFGMVVVIMIAIGVSEHGGLIWATIRKLVSGVPARLFTPTVIFAG